MAIEGPATRLQCGVSLEALVGQVADRLPASDPTHQSHCPYCRAALQILREAWDQVEAFGKAPVRIPPGLVSRIMRRIRHLAARGADAATVPGPRGRTRVSQRVLEQVARRAALTVPQVALATVAAVLVDPADQRRVRLRLRLAVAFGPVLHTLAQEVRAAVTAQLARQVGVEATDIEILIADVIAESE